MSNSLAIQNGQSVSALSRFSSEQIALLKEQIAPGCSNDELILFCEVAKRTGLDPFVKQIYAIKRKQKMTIQTSIDGLRLIAERTGMMDGSDTYWCGEDGIWKDVWVAKSPPLAAKVEVYRKECTRPFKGVAKWTEYVQLYEGRPTQMWEKFPTTMLAKCAEALALRKAFPAEMSGLHSGDEMSQANNPEHDYIQWQNESQFTRTPTPSHSTPPVTSPRPVENPHPVQSRNHIKQWIAWIDDYITVEEGKRISMALFGTDNTRTLTDEQLLQLRDALFIQWGFLQEGLFKAKKHCESAYKKAIKGIDVDADEVIFKAWETDLNRREAELNAALETDQTIQSEVVSTEVVPASAAVATDVGDDF